MDEEIMRAGDAVSGSRDDTGLSLGLGADDIKEYEVNDGVTGEIPDSEMPGGEKIKKPRAAFFFAAGFLCCIAASAVCCYIFGLGRFVPSKTYKYYKELDSSYGKFYEITRMIEKDPLAKNNAAGIGDDELKRIVADTEDPYAQYFTSEEYAQYEKKYMSEYVGIGVGVVQDGDDIVVMSVFDDGPAKEAGIEEGDVIRKVDGSVPADVDEAIAMIAGDPGTKVSITMERSGEEIEFSIVREKIDTYSVGYDELKDHPGTGYIRITSFARDTAKEFKMAVRDLEARGCERFIIDLRNNGGGLTDSSIEIADYLLPACRIMSESTKDGKETVYNSKASSADLDCAVLVNENTASASEILTAALQDNEAAVIVGSKTYGKGVTQTAHKFKDGSAVKLTMTEYFRPDGGKVNGIGITPDVEADDETALDEALRVLEK